MFSVVIPLYNKELSIKKTIQSVLDQTFQDFEIVVIDDGSTDGSIQQVEEVNDNKIRLIHQKNQGVSVARNCGIKESKFEWIALLDGDDLWEPNHLEEITKMMGLFPNEKVYVTSFKYSDNRSFFKHPRDNTIFKIENYFKEATKELLVCTGTAVIHKDCFDIVGLYNTSLKIGEDTELWNKMARKFDLVKSSNVTAIYRVEAENRTALSKSLEETYIYYINFDEIKDIAEKNYFQKMIANRLYQYARAGDLYNFRKLKRKYPAVSFRMFAQYSTKHVFKRGFEATTKNFLR